MSSKSATTKRTRTKASDKVAELKVKRMKLTDLVPHERNEEIRKHPEQGSSRWETLRKSLNRDYFDPLVHNERNGKLVSGHLRLKIMLEEGFTKADVAIVDYDDETHLARMIAANRTMGTDDLEGQKEFLKELSEVDGFDLEWSGIALPELESMKVFSEPDFDYDDDDEAIESKGVNEVAPEDDDAEERGIRYFQLIYGFEDYKEFASSLDVFRKANEAELKSEFGDEEWKDLANVVLFMLRKATT